MKGKDKSLELKDYGQSWEIAAALWNGPRTLQEIVNHFYSYVQFLGILKMTERMKTKHLAMQDKIEKTINVLIDRGWVVMDGERYALTSVGYEEARKPLNDMRRLRSILGKLAMPQTASKVGLGVHIGLAALKLPAAFISGSVGLLNDATDTFLDGIASVLVYFGFRFDKERIVNVVLVLLMLITGGITFYESVQRLFFPVKPDVDGFTFFAAIFSAVICLFLYLYQRFVGIRNGSLTLITQSIDSRNHVIVALSVTAGLIATKLNFPLLDTVVGLIVTILILKSAIELAIETIRSFGEGGQDLSRYDLEISGLYAKFRQDQLCDWMLYLVDKEVANTRNALFEQARKVYDFSGNPMLSELGVGGVKDVDIKAEKAVQTLFEKGWLNEGNPLVLSSTGKARLKSQFHKNRK